jgi:hypothetical protein
MIEPDAWRNETREFLEEPNVVEEIPDQFDDCNPIDHTEKGEKE